MAYQITLTDDEYATLSAVASQQGEPIADLVHKAIASQYPMTPMQQGGAYSYPTHQPDSSEELAEDERLATLVGSEKPWASEMVIEDRGPR